MKFGAFSIFYYFFFIIFYLVVNKYSYYFPQSFCPFLLGWSGNWAHWNAFWHFLICEGYMRWLFRVWTKWNLKRQHNFCYLPFQTIGYLRQEVFCSNTHSWTGWSAQSILDRPLTLFLTSNCSQKHKSNYDFNGNMQTKRAGSVCVMWLKMSF